MRRYLVVGVALLLTVVVAVPASADQPFVVTDSATFPDTNPCSGDPMMVTLDFVVTIHEHRNNFVVYVQRSGTTDDGFVMINGVETFVANNNVERGAFTDMWRDEAGNAFRVNGKFVFNGNQGTLVVDSFSLNCLGNT